LRVHGLVGVLDAAQGLVGEHHAEPERVVGRVALPDGDLVLRAELAGQRREVQAAGTAANDRDAQRASPRPPGAARTAGACRWPCGAARPRTRWPAGTCRGRSAAWRSPAAAPRAPGRPRTRRPARRTP